MDEIEKRKWQEGWYEIGQHLVQNTFHSISYAINDLRMDISKLSCSGDQLKFFDYIYPSISQRLCKLEEQIIEIKGMIMPLVKGKKASSKKGFSENIKREMKEGKPQKQSVAIAYSEAERGMKKKKHKKK